MNSGGGCSQRLWLLQEERDTGNCQRWSVIWRFWSLAKMLFCCPQVVFSVEQLGTTKGRLVHLAGGKILPAQEAWGVRLMCWMIDGRKTYHPSNPFHPTRVFIGSPHSGLPIWDEMSEHALAKEMWRPILAYHVFYFFGLNMVGDFHPSFQWPDHSYDSPLPLFVWAWANVYIMYFLVYFQVSSKPLG